MSSHRLRQPKPQYQGHNGFTDPPKTMSQKIEAHEHALEILSLCSVPVPSWEVISSTDWTKEPNPTVSDMELEIEDKRRDHRKLLSKLYDLHAASYREDIKFMHQSRNESLDTDPKTWMETEFRNNPNAMHVDYEDEELQKMDETSNAQKKLYNQSYPYPFSPTSPNAATLPSISRHNYEHLKMISKLQEKLRQAKGEEGRREAADRKRMEQEKYNARRGEEERRLHEERERREKEKRFPISVEDFKLKGRDMQLRVGTFLDGGKPALVPGKPSLLQEKMMVEWNWTLEETQPLLKEYATNAEFRTLIQTQNRQALASTDPRRASTSSANSSNVGV